MRPAAWPRERPEQGRLLHLALGTGRLLDARLSALPALLAEGDVLVLNDAATLPASLRGHTQGGEAVEVRLLLHEEGGTWKAVLFGAGDWRTRTEERPAPPRLAAGTVLSFGGLTARVVEVLPDSPRLVRLAFDAQGAALWTGLYAAGRPVQYAHVAGPLALWHVQTAYASRPWAAEAPSAGFGLTGEVLLGLVRRGVRLASLTHAAGLSATGEEALDAVLPLPERFDIPEATVQAVAQAHQRGGRVVAVGTTVVRALEGRAVQAGGLMSGEGTTDLRLGPRHARRVVDGLLTGVHAPGTSHFALLQSFAPRGRLEEACAHAEAEGYLGHEFGDGMLLL